LQQRGIVDPTADDLTQGNYLSATVSTVRCPAELSDVAPTINNASPTYIRFMADSGQWSASDIDLQYLKRQYYRGRDDIY